MLERHPSFQEAAYSTQQNRICGFKIMEDFESVSVRTAVGNEIVSCSSEARRPVKRGGGEIFEMQFNPFQKM